MRIVPKLSNFLTFANFTATSGTSCCYYGLYRLTMLSGGRIDRALTLLIAAEAKIVWQRHA